MFYANFILGNKRGVLGKIWMAAHWEKKLSRKEIEDLKVEDAVELIKKPTIKISLRTNGHLLLGLIRVYAKKATFVLHDLKTAYSLFCTAKLEQQKRPRHPQRPRARVGGVAVAPAEGAIEEEDEENYDQSELDLDQPANPAFNVHANPADITMNELEEALNPSLLYANDYSEQEIPFDGNFDAATAFEQELQAMSRAESVASGHLQEPMDVDERPPLHMSLEEARRSSVHGNVVPASPMDAAFGTPLPEEAYGMEPEAPYEEPDVKWGDDFQLDPLSESQIQREVQELQAQRRPRRRRPRNLIVDQETTLSDEEIRRWLQDNEPNRIELAPPTREAMAAKEKGALFSVLNLPVVAGLALNPEMAEFYEKNCVRLEREDEREREESLEADFSLPPLPQSFVDEQELPQGELNVTADFRAPSADPHELPADFTLFEEQPAAEFHEFDDPEEDAENRDPFAPPPFKRARSSPVSKSQEWTNKVEGQKHALLERLAHKAGGNPNAKIDFESSLVWTAGKKKSETAAAALYALLELRKDCKLQLEQHAPYGPIEVTLAANA
ncbi:hypothetical protein M3Y99_01070900 [Aphelenchoides fujianensis]|nr:hypothetical protein M3Y99_01070900 [Aphelenchoides fujianensis]